MKGQWKVSVVSFKRSPSSHHAGFHSGSLGFLCVGCKKKLWPQPMILTQASEHMWESQKVFFFCLTIWSSISTNVFHTTLPLGYYLMTVFMFKSKKVNRNLGLKSSQVLKSYSACTKIIKSNDLFQSDLTWFF